MQPDDITAFLSRHRRSRCWPRRCRCGLPYPCGARRVALEARQRGVSKAAAQQYSEYYARTGRWA